MALTYDSITSITQKLFIPKMADNIFNYGPILQRSREKCLKKLDGGASIMQPLNYAQESASGWYSGADTLMTTSSENLTAAEYNYKQLYANVTVTGAEEHKNRGDAQILDLVKSKIQIAEKTIKDKLATGFYSDGSDADAFQGLRDIVATDQTVGGISQSTYSFWQGNVDSTTTVLSLAVLQTAFNTCSIMGEKPTVIYATRAIYNTFWGLLQPQQRFQDSKSASAGFSSLLLNSVPFLADPSCPASHIFLLNEDYLHFYVHKDRDLKSEPFLKVPDQDIKTMKIYFMGAYGSSNNRMNYKFSAITG